eukprot:sb/3466090/
MPQFFVWKSTPLQPSPPAKLKSPPQQFHPAKSSALSCSNPPSGHGGTGSNQATPTPTKLKRSVSAPPRSRLPARSKLPPPTTLSDTITTRAVPARAATAELSTRPARTVSLKRPKIKDSIDAGRESLREQFVRTEKKREVDRQACAVMSVEMYLSKVSDRLSEERERFEEYFRSYMEFHNREKDRIESLELNGELLRREVRQEIRKTRGDIDEIEQSLEQLEERCEVYATLETLLGGEESVVGQLVRDMRNMEENNFALFEEGQEKEVKLIELRQKLRDMLQHHHKLSPSWRDTWSLSLSAEDSPTSALLSGQCSDHSLREARIGSGQCSDSCSEDVSDSSPSPQILFQASPDPKF